MPERQKKEIKNLSPVLCINAHPDDESFGFGGTISKLAMMKRPLYIASLTSGEAGQSAIPITGDLSTTRKAEFELAVTELGISSKRAFIGSLPDGKLADYPKEVEGEILKIYKRFLPGLILTMHPKSTSHPDHVIVAQTILNLKESGYFPNVQIMLQYLPNKFEPDTDDITIQIPIGDFIKQKKAAIRRHQTQNRDAERIIPTLLPYEYFLLIK